MKKTVFLSLFLALPLKALAAPYALELSAPCLMQVQDSSGNYEQVTEPAGYVTDVAQWDGVTPFTPVDACGQRLTLVPQINGVPAVGTGGTNP